MTGTINATIVGDDYRFDHQNSFPGFDFEGQMSGRIKRGAALLSTMNGPAHARVSDVAQAAAQCAHARLLGRRHHARDARRDRCADDARPARIKFPEIKTTRQPATPSTCR